MGLGSTSRAASAGSALLSRTTQSRTRICGRPAGPDVLYIDRGVIVLNKPPGLVSQGTSSVVAPVAAKNHHRQETTPLPTSISRTAFDDVLNGTVQTTLLLLGVEMSQR